MPAYPVKMGHDRPVISNPAPELGQDTRTVLADVLSYSQEQINGLRTSGAIFCQGE